MLSASRVSELTAKKQRTQMISWEILELIIDELKIEAILNKRINTKNKEELKKAYHANPSRVVSYLHLQLLSYSDFLKRFPQLSEDCKRKIESTLIKLLEKLKLLNKEKILLVEEQILDAIGLLISCYTTNFENHFGSFTAFLEIRDLLLENFEVIGFSKKQLQRKLINHEFDVIFNELDAYRNGDQIVYSNKLSQLGKKIEARRNLLSKVDYNEYRGVYLAYKCELLYKNKNYGALQENLGKIFRWHHEAYLLNRNCLAKIYDCYIQAGVDLNNTEKKSAEALYIAKFLKRMLLKDKEVFARRDKATHFSIEIYPSLKNLQDALLVTDYNIEAYEYRLWESAWNDIDADVKKEIDGHTNGHKNYFITAKHVNILLPLLEKYQIGYQLTDNATQVRIMQIFSNSIQLVKLITNAYVEEVAKLSTIEKPVEVHAPTNHSTTALLQNQYAQAYLTEAVAKKNKPQSARLDKRTERKRATLPQSKEEVSDYDVKFAHGFTYLEKGRSNVFAINSSRCPNTFIGIHPTVRKYLALKDRGSSIEGRELKELEAILDRGKEAGGEGQKGIILSPNKFSPRQEDAKHYAKVKACDEDLRYLAAQDQMVYHPKLGWCTFFSINTIKPSHGSEKIWDVAKIERKLKKLGAK